MLGIYYFLRFFITSFNFIVELLTLRLQNFNKFPCAVKLVSMLVRLIPSFLYINHRSAASFRSVISLTILAGNFLMKLLNTES